MLQVANGSMITDIPMLMDMLTGNDSAELENLRLVRAGRAAKAGARAGRIFRLMRVIRLVRVFKLLKLASKLRKQREQGDRSGGKDLNSAQNRQNLSNVGLRMMEAIARHQFLWIMLILSILDSHSCEDMLCNLMAGDAGNTYHHGRDTRVQSAPGRICLFERISGEEQVPSFVSHRLGKSANLHADNSRNWRAKMQH